MLNVNATLLFYYGGNNNLLCWCLTETFERAFENVIRLQKNRRTLTASETEDRGRGLRVKQRKLEGDSNESNPSQKQNLKLQKQSPAHQNFSQNSPNCV